MRLLIAAILLFSPAAYADEFNDIQIFDTPPGSMFVQADILDTREKTFGRLMVGAAIPVSRSDTLHIRASTTWEERCSCEKDKRVMARWTHRFNR